MRLRFRVFKFNSRYFSLDFKIFLLYFSLLMLTYPIQPMQIYLYLWTRYLFCFPEAFIQVPSLEYFKKVSKFFCNQYLSYLHFPSEPVLLILKNHNQKWKYTLYSCKMMLSYECSNIKMAISVLMLQIWAWNCKTLKHNKNSKDFLWIVHSCWFIWGILKCVIILWIPVNRII